MEFVLQTAADNALIQLHQSQLNGTTLDLRYDNRFKKTNYSVAKTIKDQENYCKSCKRQKKESTEPATEAYYSSESLIIGDKEYPIPQGKYLIKLLRLCHSSMHSESTRPLLDLLTSPRHGNKHGKELTESMAMVDAVFRLGHITSTDWTVTPRVNVYVVADGKTPYTTAALGLFLPVTWRFAAIDPILSFDGQLLCEFASRCHLVPSMSQDYAIQNYFEQGDDQNRSTDRDNEVPKVHNIVIACHSHAPLQEFWDRVPTPKYAVVMPCCGKNWSSLSCSPVDTYDDFEVYSPKRKIFLYCTRDI